ncbi:MAG: septal ring lytic transglycosylase RlpA family protein [Candidatus Peribacteraceae bacterium]|nr:septal ring lytic transglycosylase RlpA family protein [Candidatus Peribacteraceae bacterium]
MYRLTILLVSFAVMATAFTPLTQAANPINRADAFLLVWNSAFRPAFQTSEKPFVDIKKTDKGYKEIVYAKARGILDDDDTNFYPTANVDFATAMLWLFRTRSVESPKEGSYKGSASLPDIDDIPALLVQYDMATPSDTSRMTEEQLLAYMRFLDGQLTKVVHESSLYSEKFHGKGTAFGEAFDMHALTAAHRSFPHNTLVKVTNIKNGLSVVVRINDRGPFVKGRDMDLSLAAFETIAYRASGKINVTFERMGDNTLLNQCNDTRYMRRLTRDLLINPGIPHFLALGKTLSLTAEKFFAVESITYPDGTVNDTPKWYAPGSALTVEPSIIGQYRLQLRDTAGNSRVFPFEVLDCSTTSGSTESDE